MEIDCQEEVVKGNTRRRRNTNMNLNSKKFKCLIKCLDEGKHVNMLNYINKKEGIFEIRLTDKKSPKWLEEDISFFKCMDATSQKKRDANDAENCKARGKANFQKFCTSGYLEDLDTRKLEGTPYVFHRYRILKCPADDTTKKLHTRTKSRVQANVRKARANCLQKPIVAPLFRIYAVEVGPNTDSLRLSLIPCSSEVQNVQIQANENSASISIEENAEDFVTGNVNYPENYFQTEILNRDVLLAHSKKLPILYDAHVTHFIQANENSASISIEENAEEDFVETNVNYSENCFQTEILKRDVPLAHSEKPILWDADVAHFIQANENSASISIEENAEDFVKTNVNYSENCFKTEILKRDVPLAHSEKPILWDADAAHFFNFLDDVPTYEKDFSNKLTSHLDPVLSIAWNTAANKGSLSVGGHLQNEGNNIWMDTFSSIE